MTEGASYSGPLVNTVSALISDEMRCGKALALVFPRSCRGRRPADRPGSGVNDVTPISLPIRLDGRAISAFGQHDSGRLRDVDAKSPKRVRP
jgi:hypothetical protein